MFNAFDGAPKVVRLWGQGRVLEYGTEAYEMFKSEHKVHAIDGTRAIVVVDVQQVGSSCGFSVPNFEFVSYRTTLNEFFEKRVQNEEKGDHANGIER